MKKKKSWYGRIFKWLFGLALMAFILINVFSAVQAYSATHFKENMTISDSVKLSTFDIAKMFVLGVDIPKPKAKRMPDRKYEEVRIPVSGDKSLAAWTMRSDSAQSKGIIIYFHGYTDEKSMLLDYAYRTLDMGYDAMMVDFRAAGESFGTTCTVGYREAQDVKHAYDYARDVLKEDNVYLLGFSMGAAAILKAQHDYQMDVKGLIIEASYGKMFDTVKIRLQKMGKLQDPLAYLFTFWGGMMCGIDGFRMNPEDFARDISVPTLVACGGKDQYIPQNETMRIFDNLASNNKRVKFYPNCIHEPYLKKYEQEWLSSVGSFLKDTE